MAQHRTIRFEGEVAGVLGHLTEQQQLEREANAAAAAVIREHKQYEGPVTTADQKKTLIAEGHAARRRHREKQLLLKDPNAISLGDVLKKQKPLLRREMFRRRLFPIRFDSSARNVEEVQQLLMQRKPIWQLVVSILYLAMLLLFLSFALEITKMFEAADGIRTPVDAALAPTPSNFNAISFELAKAGHAQLTPTVTAIAPETGRPAGIMTLNSKSGVASWLVYGFIPLIYGASPLTSNLGSARVLGNCFRLTFRQVRAAV